MSQLTSTYQKKVAHVPILVVEDNADSWLIIRAVLKECFPEVAPIWVSDHKQAIVYLDACTLKSNQRPKLILQDLYLPRREDGLALLKSIKTHPVYHSMLICILSQSDDQADMEACYQLGSASFITKPITYHQWKATFYSFRAYWWTIVTLPSG
jgi:CheY-like chemotaxis protein